MAGKSSIREHPYLPPRCGGRLWRLAAALALCLVAGCEAPPKKPDQGANQSLVEIGEHSLELAEELENKNRPAEANNAYKRALWAFRYHEKLTGEEPLLLDDALDGLDRTASR